MGLLGKFLGKQVGQLGAKAKKLESKDLVEACVGGMILIAYADGDFEESEKKALEEIVAANDRFSAWSGDIGGMIDKFDRIMRAGKVLGKTKILKEIRDMKSASTEDKEEVFACIVSVSMADGEVEPEEKKILLQIGRELGLNAESYLE